jgi:hypothetical protein
MTTETGSKPAGVKGPIGSNLDDPRGQQVVRRAGSERNAVLPRFARSDAGRLVETGGSRE